MSLRVRIFIIVSILVFLILGVSIFLAVRNKSKTPEPQTAAPAGITAPQSGEQSNGQVPIGIQAPAGLPAKTATPLEAQKNAVVQLAKVFVERYGTYSTDNNFQNIKDTQTLVTQFLWSKISAPIISKTTSQNFVGMTTKVISMNLTGWSDAKAAVELKTIRTEEKNSAVATRYQNATVELIKVNALWLVDKMSWN